MKRARWWQWGWLWLGLAVGATGCSGCEEEEKAPAPVVSAEPEQTIAPTGPVQGLTAPEGVLAFGGSKDLASLAATLGGMVGQPGSKDVAAKGMADMLGLAPTAIALDKPVRFVVADPDKGAKEPVMVALTMGGKDAVASALPTSKKANVDGHDFRYKARNKTVFVDVLGDFAVFSFETKHFPTFEKFVLQVLGAEVGPGAAVVFSAANASKLYAKELDEALAAMEKDMASPALGGLGDGMKDIVGWLAKSAKEIDAVTLRIADVEGGATLAFDVQPKKETELAKTLAGVKPKPLSYLDKLPRESAGAFVASIEPGSLKELTQSLMRWSLRVSAGDDVDPKYEEAAKAYADSLSGEMAMAFHPVPGDATKMGLSAVFGITDADATRKAIDTLQELQDTDAVKKRYEDMGMKVTTKRGSYQAAGVKVTETNMELEMPKGAAPPGATDALSQFLHQHWAVGDDLGVLAYGDDGKAIVTAWLDGSMPGGLSGVPGVARARKHEAKGVFLLTWIDPVRLLGALIPQAPGGKPAEGGLAITAGASEGTLHIVIDAPTAVVQSLAQTMMSGGGRIPL